MDRIARRNRTFLVGAYVVGVAVLLTFVILWLVGSRFLRPVDRYLVIFKSSVSGLSPGASVELNGVAVGKVSAIHLTHDSPPRVEVDLEVAPGTPIRRDSVATLGGSLITSIRLIQISGGTEKAGELGEDEAIPVDELSFDDIRRQANDLTQQTRQLLLALNQGVFNQQNRDAFGHLVQDFSATAHSLKLVSDAFASAENIKVMQATLANLSEATTHLNETATALSSRRNEMIHDLSSALKRLDRTLATSEHMMTSADDLVTRGGSELQQTVKQLHRTSRHIDEAVDTLVANPSALLWGTKVSDREKAQ